MRRNHLSLVILSIASMLSLASFQNCSQFKAFGNGEPYEGIIDQPSTVAPGPLTPPDSAGSAGSVVPSAESCEPQDPADAIRGIVISNNNSLVVKSWFNSTATSIALPWNSTTRVYDQLVALNNGLFLQRLVLNSNRTVDVFYSDSYTFYHQTLICK